MSRWLTLSVEHGGGTDLGSVSPARPDRAKTRCFCKRTQRVPYTGRVRARMGWSEREPACSKQTRKEGHHGCVMALASL